jgi:cellulose biosynthesis protein BcsQ
MDSVTTSESQFNPAAQTGRTLPLTINIAVASPKGGVGKTTSLLGLAFRAATTPIGEGEGLPYKVAVYDGDPHGNLVRALLRILSVSKIPIPFTLIVTDAQMTHLIAGTALASHAVVVENADLEQYDLVFMDTPGNTFLGLSGEANEAVIKIIDMAGLCVVPYSPDVDEMDYAKLFVRQLSPALPNVRFLVLPVRVDRRGAFNKNHSMRSLYERNFEGLGKNVIHAKNSIRYSGKFAANLKNLGADGIPKEMLLELDDILAELILEANHE